jgi:hypothetical protein
MKTEILNLVNRLTSLPEKISSLQLDALDQNIEINNIQDDIIARESDLKSEINQLVDENGKKVYSNDDSRKATFLIKSKEDADLTLLYSNKKDLTNKLDILRIEIEALSNEQRNIRAILSIFEGITL